MANASGMYALTIKDVFYNVSMPASGLDSETVVYGMLITNAYTPNFDTDHYRSAISTNEPGASGTYATGGSALTSTAITTASPAATQMKYATSSPQWTSATLTAHGLGGYYHRGGASSADEMWWDSDFGGDVSSSAGTYTVTCPTNGWWYLDVA